LRKIVWVPEAQIPHLPKRFFSLLKRNQGTPAIDGAARTMWIFEPHVAEQVFEDLIAERG